MTKEMAEAIWNEACETGSLERIVYRICKADGITEVTISKAMKLCDKYMPTVVYSSREDMRLALNHIVACGYATSKMNTVSGHYKTKGHEKNYNYNERVWTFIK